MASREILRFSTLNCQSFKSIREHIHTLLNKTYVLVRTQILEKLEDNEVIGIFKGLLMYVISFMPTPITTLLRFNSKFKHVYGYSSMKKYITFIVFEIYFFINTVWNCKIWLSSIVLWIIKTKKFNSVDVLPLLQLFFNKSQVYIF